MFLFTIKKIKRLRTLDTQKKITYNKPEYQETKNIVSLFCI